MTVSQKLARVERALDALYDAVERMPDSSLRDGQLRYLDNTYRSVRRQREIIGGKSALKKK